MFSVALPVKTLWEFAELAMTWVPAAVRVSMLRYVRLGYSRMRNSLLAFNEKSFLNKPQLMLNKMLFGNSGVGIDEIDALISE